MPLMPYRPITGTRLVALALVASAGSLGTVAVAPSASAASLCASGSAGAPTATFATPNSALGGTITLQGTGWCHPDGTGSAIGVKLDEGGISHLTTAVHANKTIWALVEADADGRFSTQIKLPDGTTATSAPAFATGVHTMRLLSGSLKAGDTGRTLATGNFTVGLPAPAWPHQVVAQGGATAWIEDVVGTGDKATLRIAGTGWTMANGRPSTVAVKLASGAATQYSRPEGEKITHPTAAGDATVWALVMPGGGSSPLHPMAADGSFELTIDLPSGLADSQYLAVQLASGRFANGDTQRTLRSSPVQVGSGRGKDEALGGGKCTPTSATPTLKILTPVVARGGILKVEGEGWCHPSAGGSVVGMKIDEGAIAHLDTSVHTNTTIWAIVNASDKDGRFTADIQLPDGTTATSLPAMKSGQHTLRLLTGSLKPGDAGRTLLSEPFVVGSYRPNGYPLPFDAASLRDTVRGGIAATRKGRTVRAIVADGRPGDWVHLSVYLPDGSPRTPWADRWYRLDADGSVSVRLPRSAAASQLTGPVKLVVTNGNQGHAGELLGWDDLVLPATPTEPTEPTDSTAPSENGGPTGQPTAPGELPARPGTVSPPATPTVVTDPATPPLTEPAPPAKNFVGIGMLDRGKLSVARDGSTLTVTFPGLKPGDLVHTRLYGADDWAAGWAALKPRGRLVLSLADLPSGTYRLAFQDHTGALLGWIEQDWSPSPPKVITTTTTAALNQTDQPALVAATSDTGPTVVDGVLVGFGGLVFGASALLRRRAKALGVLR